MTAPTVRARSQAASSLSAPNWRCRPRTPKAEHTEGRSVALFGMRPVAHQALHERGSVIAGAGGAGDRALGRHAAVALMRLGHVFLDGGVATALAPAVMQCNPLMIMENLDHAVGQPDIDMSSDQAMRHGIETVQNLDVVIGMHLGPLPFGILKGRIGQRAECGAFNLFEQLPPRAPDPAHGPGIQIIEQLGNGDVQRLDGKELPVAQAGIVPQARLAT